jgi:hypothetical protein
MPGCGVDRGDVNSSLMELLLEVRQERGLSAAMRPDNRAAPAARREPLHKFVQMRSIDEQVRLGPRPDEL